MMLSILVTQLWESRGVAAFLRLGDRGPRGEASVWVPFGDACGLCCHISEEVRQLDSGVLSCPGCKETSLEFSGKP